jgi:hypothetical protein
LPNAPLTLQQLRADRLLIWCWLPLGSFAMYAVIQAWHRFAGEPPQALYTVLDVVWIAVTFTLIARRTSRRCPECNHRWLRSFPWMSLKKVQCAACGHQMPER